MSRVLRYLGGALSALLLLLLILLGYGYFRPNRARVVDALGIEHWAAVSDGAHNSNTDLIYWRGAFYLVHASSPWHFASEKCRLVIWRSEDARHWERLAELNVPGGTFATRRYQPQPWGPLTELGSVLSRKRTALFRVDEDRLTWLSDLPSAGDTSYASTVIRGDFLYVSYY
jgi:hypothetical protein